jgi:hypothetical protein
VCPPAPPGFTLIPDTEWLLISPGAAEGAAGNASEAEGVCNTTSNCVAWNSNGSYVLGNASAVSYQPLVGMCVYVKDPGK